MSNRLLILGRASPKHYEDVFLNLCSPENLLVVVTQEDYTNELDSTLKALNIQVLVVNEESKGNGLEKIVVFTDYIGLDEVLMLTDATEQKIPVIFINPK